MAVIGSCAQCQGQGCGGVECTDNDNVVWNSHSAQWLPADRVGRRSQWNVHTRDAMLQTWWGGAG